MSSAPEIQAEIVFLPEYEGGRKSLPGFGGPPIYRPFIAHLSPFYRPHIVIQDRTVCRAITDSDGYNRETYLGVQFVAGPSSPIANVPDTYRMSLTYFPRINYSAAQPGATFTVREGCRIVGHGVVKARQDG